MLANHQLSDDVVEKIVALLDREAGHDAPLTIEDEASVRSLLERDSEARRFADELRAANARLDTLFDDVAGVEVPDGLTTMLRGQQSGDLWHAKQPGTSIRLDSQTGSGQVTEPLADVLPPTFGYGGLAAAASLAFFVSCGALLHLYTTFEDDRSNFAQSLAAASASAKASQKDLADAVAELERVQVIAEQAADEGELAARELATKGDMIARLEIEQAALQGRFEELISENDRLSDIVSERTIEAAAVDEERRLLIADLAEVQEALYAERNQTSMTRGVLRLQASDLAGQLAEKERRLATLALELEDANSRSATNDAALVAMQSERQTLKERLADLDDDYQALIAERDEAERAVAAAEEKAATLEGDLVIAEASRQAAMDRVADLEADLAASTSWLNQVAQYHRIYAATARRHLVEVGADEQPHIERWLATVLGRPIPVPDLSADGLTFQGARLLGVNEKPVAELVYLDHNDQPVAFCIIPSDEEAQEPTVSANRDLNLVDWRDGRYAYALVGWSDPALLTLLTRSIRPLYEI